MFNRVNLIFFLTLLIFSSCVQITKKKTKRMNIAEQAIQRIKDRLFALRDTSCKVAAKFILLAICNVTEKEQLSVLPLSGITELDLRKIKEKVNEGYVVQIEIKANHHFIIFKKNDKDLYLLQAFQDRFMLKDWMGNSKIMKPFLTIDEFFDKMRIMLNPDTPIRVVEDMILDLFLPEEFTEDQKLIDSMLDYFGGNPVTLVNVSYAKFNFGIKYDDMRFRQLFHKVDYSYLIY